MTKDLFEGAFVGAGSTGFAVCPRTDFHRSFLPALGVPRRVRNFCYNWGPVTQDLRGMAIVEAIV